MHDVVAKFELTNIICDTTVSQAHFSDGVWTVKIRNARTGVEATKTSNIVIMAVGGLREPLLPKFAVGNTDFEGTSFHSARWDHSVDLKGKDVVLVGNGCTACQIVSMSLAVRGTTGPLTSCARATTTGSRPCFHFQTQAVADTESYYSEYHGRRQEPHPGGPLATDVHSPAATADLVVLVSPLPMGPWGELVSPRTPEGNFTNSTSSSSICSALASSLPPNGSSSSPTLSGVSAAVPSS